MREVRRYCRGFSNSTLRTSSRRGLADSLRAGRWYNRTHHVSAAANFTFSSHYTGNSLCSSCLQPLMRRSGTRSTSCSGTRTKFVRWFLCLLCSRTLLGVSCVTHQHLTSVASSHTIQLSIVWVMRGVCLI